MSSKYFVTQWRWCLQAGPRGKREREFYERLVSEIRLEKLEEINATPTDERGDQAS